VVRTQVAQRGLDAAGALLARQRAARGRGVAGGLVRAFETEKRPRRRLGRLPDHVLGDGREPAEEGLLALPVEVLDRPEGLEKGLLDDVARLEPRPHPAAHARVDARFESRRHQADEIVERVPVPLASSRHHDCDRLGFPHGDPLCPHTFDSRQGARKCRGKPGVVRSRGATRS